MRKVVLSAFIIVSFVIYAIINGRSMDAVTKSPVASSDPTPTALPTSAPTDMPHSSQMSAAVYKDGQYTGDVADAYYGNIQVKAIVSGGKITDVQFLQYPNDQDHSIEINQMAMPILKEEAIQAQSGNVDIVSRATDTSQAFIQSLTSALQQAQQ